MVRELTAFDQEWHRNNKLNLLPAPARTSTRTMDTAKAPESKPTRATPALFTQTTFLPKPTMLERVKTAVPASSGNCFKCGKPGHFQDKCPLNATTLLTVRVRQFENAASVDTDFVSNIPQYTVTRSISTNC
ncbi:hypothetical protein VC83_00425 [Pseudogymnoascus destructans]|uniref:CCHC-type domain-containing protein n=2 Tax=Pseudogymnoascus destructans TaxID=655981 RepID=L8G5W3_PSED2|nr:uncharacterized protein VC83_00425 [Pseudogymnoascus destructans]ELR08517.1 hypothetical protein GMDG_03216 [Pseudogymnoascus destructans 20631-21]OAF63486.1 hypothetical protein VC83_00425 [Pseudogymnoascus destructans]